MVVVVVAMAEGRKRKRTRERGEGRGIDAAPPRQKEITADYRRRREADAGEISSDTSASGPR